MLRIFVFLSLLQLAPTTLFADQVTWEGFECVEYDFRRDKYSDDPLRTKFIAIDVATPQIEWNGNMLTECSFDPFYLNCKNSDLTEIQIHRFTARMTLVLRGDLDGTDLYQCAKVSRKF